MAGMTADAVYVLLGNEIVLLTEKIEQMGGWEPIEHKGTVQTAEDLPTDAKKGWMYNIATDSIYGAAGMNVVMTSEGWDSMGPIINMTPYLTKEEAGKSYQPKGNYLSETDSTLTEPGKAADAKETGDKFSKTSADLEKKLDKNQGSENSGKIAGINESGDIVPMFPVGVEYNEETNCLEFGSDQGMKLNQGIGLDSTLTKTGFAADAGVTGKEINSLKESMASKITKFYASSQGETHITDSDNGKIMDMMVYGKSEQKQYSGKNLFKATLGNVTADGITCTANSDGTYILNGTCTVSTALSIIGIFDHILNEPLYLTGVPSGCGSYLALGRRDGDNILVTDGKNVKIDAGIHTDHIEFWITEGTVLNNVIFKPMITADPTATYDDFEPYTGGIPSPNPSYPQEILSVKNPTVKVCGKNLLNYDAWKGISILKGKATFENNGVTITATQNDSYTEYNPNANKPYPIDAQIKVNEGEVVTLSWEADNKNGSIYIFGNGNERGFAQANNNNAKKLSYTVPNGITFITFRFGVANAGDTISYRNIQIEKSSTPTAYEPYHEQTVTLPYDLYGIKVPSGGNVTIGGQQYVSDYFDVERGKLVRMCKEVDLGALSYVYIQSEKRFSAKVSNAYTRNPTDKHVICKNYIAASANETYLHKYKYAIAIISNIIYVSNDDCTTPESFKTANSGVKAYYILDTPEETDLTEEEIAAFKALATYYPVTNISVNSEELDGYTVFNYPISMKNGWDYVKKQLNDNRDYIYDMDARTQNTDLQAAEAYVNSEYAVALTELEA